MPVQYKDEIIDPPETPTICWNLMLRVAIASKMPMWADSLVPPPENIGTILLTEYVLLDNYC
jgi:hypothetical protein